MSETGVCSYRRFLKGDSDALEELIRTYSDPLTRFAFCYVGSAAAAEEVMEDALTDVLLKGKRFDDEAHFKAYLYKAVRHRAINYLRHHRKHVPLEDVENVLSCGDMEADAIKLERDRTVFACMQVLPEQYRQALTLKYFDGFSVEEICSVTGQSSKQVYNLLSRAKTALGKILEKVGISHEDL